MVSLDEIKEYLKLYDGPEMNIMEVCGSHTAAIAKNGIPSMLSDKIHLLSGPGCPVCVTPSAYIDKLIELSHVSGNVIATFGDLIRVPGSAKSLSIAKGEGADVRMVYSPFDVVSLSKSEPDKTFIFAGVGFETTTPVYAELLDIITSENIRNIKLLTALKTMPPVIDFLCANGAPVDGFIAPGHVCVITGSDAFIPLAKRYSLPFGVAGFSGKELLEALYGLVKARGKGEVFNFYPSVVTREGNVGAQEAVDKYFEVSDAAWRGMGIIKGSGLLLRDKYKEYDAGSSGLIEDHKKNIACQCDQILMGKKKPGECPLFGKTCTPLNPQGACMVSQEGSCFSYLVNNRK